MHRFVRLARSDLHGHAVSQELIGAQIGLVKRDAGGVRGSLEPLQSGGDVCGGEAAGREVVAQQCGLDWTVVIALAPLAEIAIAELVSPRRVGEQRDDAVLSAALGAWLLKHGCGRRKPAESYRSAAPASSPA